MESEPNDQYVEEKRRQIERALKTGLSKLDKILPRVLRKSGLERRLREHALFSLWPSIVGEVLAQRSRPLYVDLQSNLVITVSDSAVAQEIQFARMQLLQKLIPFSKASGVDIKGLRVDLKHYYHKDEPQPAEEQVTLPDPDENALKKIELGPSQLQMLEELKAELEPAAEGSKQEGINKRILMMYETQLRLGVWRKSRGFPVCEQCGFAVSRLHSVGRSNICFGCSLQSADK